MLLLNVRDTLFVLTWGSSIPRPRLSSLCAPLASAWRDVAGGQVVGEIAAPHEVLSVAEWRANRDGPGKSTDENLKRVFHVKAGVTNPRYSHMTVLRAALLSHHHDIACI